MFLTLADFEFVCFDAEGSRYALEGMTLKAANFDMGANHSRLSPPRAFTSYGQLTLNMEQSGLSEDVVATFASLKVSTAGYDYLNLIIRDYEFKNERNEIALYLVGRGGDLASVPFIVSILPAPGLSGTRLETLISKSRLTAVSPVGVTLYPLIAGGSIETVGSGPPKEYNYRGQSFIADVESFGSLVMLERCNTDQPEYMALPLPLGRNDDRVEKHTYTERNSYILVDGWTTGRTLKWQADTWQIINQSPAWQERLLLKEGRGGSTIPPYYEIPIKVRGAPNRPPPIVIDHNLLFNVNQLDSDGMIQSEFGGFIDIKHWSIRTTSDSDSQTQLWSPPQISTDGRVITAYPANSSTEKGETWRGVLRIQVSYYKSVNVSYGRFLIQTGQDAEKRELRTGQLSVVRGSESQALLGEILSYWNEWDARWARFVLHAKEHQEGHVASIPQKQPGDVVGFVSEGIRHKCIITRIGWQAVGLNPISFTWNIVASGELASPPDETNWLTLDGEPITLDGEPLALPDM